MDTYASLIQDLDDRVSALQDGTTDLGEAAGLALNGLWDAVNALAQALDGGDIDSTRAFLADRVARYGEIASRAAAAAPGDEGLQS